MGQYSDLQEQVFYANMALWKSGLVFSTFGNVSGIDRAAGVIAIKPSGVPYDELRPESMVVVDMDNAVVTAAHGEKPPRPSSDTKTHLFLYKHFTEIGGAVHTHSRFATAWAQARRPIPVLGTTHADQTAFDIPCTAGLSAEQITRDYEMETGRQITDTFRELSYRDIPMVLVRSHGPFSWGRTPDQAVHASVMLEELAHIAYLSLQINPEAPRLDPALIKKHYERKHGRNAYYGQP